MPKGKKLSEFEKAKFLLSMIKILHYVTLLINLAVLTRLCAIISMIPMHMEQTKVVDVPLFLVRVKNVV